MNRFRRNVSQIFDFASWPLMGKVTYHVRGFALHLQFRARRFILPRIHIISFFQYRSFRNIGLEVYHKKPCSLCCYSCVIRLLSFRFCHLPWLLAVPNISCRCGTLFTQPTIGATKPKTIAAWQWHIMFSLESRRHCSRASPLYCRAKETLLKEKKQGEREMRNKVAREVVGRDRD